MALLLQSLKFSWMALFFILKELWLNKFANLPYPPLESREPRNIVLSKFCSRIDRKFDVCLIACVSGSLDHILYM